MYDNAGIFRTQERLERLPRRRSRELRERGGDVVVDDTGDRFNTDLDLGARARVDARDGRLPRHAARSRARSRAARTRASTSPSATTRAGCSHTLAWYDGGEVRLDYKPVTVTRFEPDGRGATERRCGWKSPSRSGARPTARRTRLETYTVEVPETATLLDALDAVKDKRDGTLAYRKSCRMAVCGSCGMRMDGGAVLACKTAMKPLVEAGHVPTISPMGNLPVIKDLVVDMEPFWAKIRAVKPFLQTD